MPKIVEIPEGTIILEPGYIDPDTDYIYLPKSIKRIKANAIRLYEPMPDTFHYAGTLMEALHKITIEEPNDILVINCADGNRWVHKL